LSILALSLLPTPDYSSEKAVTAAAGTGDHEEIPSMKHFMIKYQFANGTTEAWHQEVAGFIASLNSDPELKGKIRYRVMKNRDDASYFHLAAAADEQAVKILQSRDFFKHYTERTRQVAGGEVTVTPIEVIAETG
jgi:hypothetical protein